MRTASILPDGSPTWLASVERYLVGGAMRALSPEHVVNAATVCISEDFRDATLGMIWDVLPGLDCPCWVHVAEALLANGDIDRVGGEPRLVELAGSEMAFLYSARVCLEAHAELVHRYAEQRRALQRLQVEAERVFSGGAAGPSWSKRFTK